MKTYSHDDLMPLLMAVEVNAAEAVLRTPTGALRDQMSTIVLLANDCQRAVQRIADGDNPDEVLADIIEQHKSE